MNNFIEIPILLENNKKIKLVIYAESPGTLFIINEQDAIENGESPYQLEEGKNYEYILPEEYCLEESAIIKQSKIETNKGRIQPNIYVGSLEINVLHQQQIVGKLNLEIRSIKAKYREDYREMLKDITTKCTDLLLRQSSPIYQTFTVDIHKDSQTLYQRFAFVESISKSEQFFDALHRINSMPVKRWETTETPKDISNIRRVNNSIVRQIITANNRTLLNANHSLKNKLDSLPNKVKVIDKKETTDIPENRFIKHVLETFLQFCLSIYRHPKADQRLKRDALTSSELLNKYLSLPVFREVSKLDIIPLNSPVLQRKEGYREILQIYLMFDMAANLIWKGGENVYKGGKKDVAVLYEYWLFFKLLDLMEEIFHIKPKSINDIIKITNEGLELTLKQGNLKMVDGVFKTKDRNLHIEFYYNRTFSSAPSYPNAGSWTRNMRPDYTLSIWPEGLSREEAEEREIIAHIHFDAKYKIDNYETIFRDINLDTEKEEQAKGDYKRADLLKMHTYKDAIRRTVGSYILYPGKEKKTFQNFHELLPGVGAFAISPKNPNNTALKKFLLDIVEHFLNRASQRELFSYYTFNTFKESPGPYVKSPLPNDDGSELPATTFVIVGYYKSETHLKWIKRNKLYNVRTDFRKGALKLSHETTSAKYLLLHGENNLQTPLIFRLESEGPRVISKDYLENKNYPSSSIQPYYIGYSLQSSDPVHEEFGNIKWDITKLEKYQTKRNSAIPFVVTLQELMQAKQEE